MALQRRLQAGTTVVEARTGLHSAHLGEIQKILLNRSIVSFFFAKSPAPILGAFFGLNRPALNKYRASFELFYLLNKNNALSALAERLRYRDDSPPLDVEDIPEETLEPR